MKNGKNGASPEPAPTVLFSVLAFPEGISVERPDRVLFLSWADLGSQLEDHGTPTEDAPPLEAPGWPAPIPVRDFVLVSPEA